MQIRPLKTETDYNAALKEIERYFEREPAPGSRDADRFNLLALVIGDYEDRHWPIDPPDPVAAIEFAMEQRGVTRAQLEPILGSRARVSEILARKRHLTLPMIWRLHRALKIPAESLIGPYALSPSRPAKAAAHSASRKRSRHSALRTRGV
jgi:HTH-type transcriptional regulator/antitoxin HigA